MNSGFRNAGYLEDTRIGFGVRPAVIVVDFQRAFTDLTFPLAQSMHVQRAVENTAVLLRAARAVGAPVAQCYIAYSSAREALQWKVKVVTDTFRHDWAGTELDPRIYDPDYDVVYRKKGPSSFFGTSLVQFLIAERVDTVFVTGCTTSGCVRASIIDAFSYGFRVMAPEPCCGDQEEAAHHANLQDVGRRYADVITLEEGLRYFETLPPRE